MAVWSLIYIRVGSLQRSLKSCLLAYSDKARNTIWTGWRLPTVSPINGHSLQKDFAFDGTSEIGINITSPGSELSHLFYVSLNNIANSASIDVGPFINVVTTEAFGDWYWTSTNYPYSGNETKYYFDFAIGAQNASGLGLKQFAWPVRNGDVGPTTVPLPGCGWLATYTLACLAARRRSKSPSS